jgi:VWFA-related protein
VQNPPCGVNWARMRQLARALGMAVLITATVRGQTPVQDPQPPATTFRTAIDLVPVDVNIIDNSGRPVTGLTAKDFMLTVDGKPRRISSAEYMSTVSDLKPVAPIPTNVSSNTAGSGGRMIMLVVDQANIAPGRGRSALDAAARFVGKLSPADRIGLVAIPGTGPHLDFTSNHAVVQALLPGLAGQAESFHTTFRIGISEAFAAQQGDRFTTNEMLQRECGSQRTADEIDACTRQVLADANGIYSVVRERSLSSLVSLKHLIERLSATPSPKTLVFISEGLVLERQLSDISWLGPAAARGQVTIYVMQLDTPLNDASSRREAATPSRDRTLAQEGLGVLAGLTRGSVFNVVSNGDNAFARLALETSGYYLLSFEPDAGDRDGKAHKIKIGVPGRQDIDIRARSEFSVDAAPAATTEDSTLAETLKAPLLATDIGLKLTTYTLRDPASDKLRILLAADIDRSINADSRLALAFMLVDDKGRLVATQIDRDVKTPINPDTKVQTYSGFALSDATGAHTLKIAVVDDRGRRGSVEHTFRASLTSAGQVRATDLLIAEKRPAADGVVPIVGGEITSGVVNNYIELYSDAPEVLQNATVMFEVAQDEQARALDGAAGRLQPPPPDAPPNRRALEGSVPVGLLPPGNYVARAVISIDGRKAGQVARPFRVGRTVTARNTPPAPATKPGSLRTAPIPFASRTERFDRGSVLTPQVVGFFLDRMNFGARGEPNAGPVIEHARAGRFDEAVQALSARTATVPSVFLRGLALYSKGDLEGAAGKFRETLQLDPEFFPAAFYLGSCYAAGNRDQQAVGAWQMSLVTESDAPFIFTLLGDALLRLKDINHALEILNEASAVWPDNEEVQVRLAATLAMAGRRAEALQILEPYLEKHPEDAERHYLGLRTIYEARADKKPIRSAEEDRALFTRWAKAYAAAKGPQQAIVDQWAKAMR